MSDGPPTAREQLSELRDKPVSEIPEGVGAAEILAEETGKSVEEFTPDFDEHPIPDASEQEWMEEL